MKKQKKNNNSKESLHEAEIPFRNLSKEEMREILMGMKETESVTGARYVKMHVTKKMIIGIGESSGKEFTINLDQLYDAYLHCEKYTSPMVKKYIFMGHSPALAILRHLKR